jgi:hypothetical protein
MSLHRSSRVGFLMLCSQFIFGCASTSVIKSVPSIPSSQCAVTVYTSMDSAKSRGNIEELCIISGTSSGSFSHTVATAIEKHRDKACRCGADNVYIQAQDAGTLGTASVTLVGFRFTEIFQEKKSQESVKSSPTTEIVEKAKRCQSKGGVWVNDSCQISVD